MEEYPHADFLENIPGIPKHWFKPKKGSDIEGYYFTNAKENYKSLVITDGLTGYYHVIYGGRGLGAFKTESKALAYAKSYMRKN